MFRVISPMGNLRYWILESYFQDLAVISLQFQPLDRCKKYIPKTISSSQEFQKIFVFPFAKQTSIGNLVW